MLANEDLELVLLKAAGSWNNIRDKKLFITGGTGFIGTWLLETLAFANAKLDLNSEAFILTRDIRRFSQKAPHLIQNKKLHFIQGDVRDFKFPDGPVDYVIHAAADVNGNQGKENSFITADTIVKGTNRVLEYAKEKKAEKFLYVSSGAVYGTQPGDLKFLTEAYTGSKLKAPLPNSYGDAKRQAELLCLDFGNKNGISVSVSRCFTFAGPYLDLNLPFAICEFIKRGLAGKEISVAGDGKARRTYMYAADLAVWLWTILTHAKPGEIYNVGSDEEVSIGELAQLVAEIFNQRKLTFKNSDRVASYSGARYVPSIQKAKSDLGLKIYTGLRDTVDNTIKFALTESNNKQNLSPQS